MIHAGAKAGLSLSFRPADERARSFCLQYLSVILIVLSFTIGAFLRGGTAAEPAAEAAPEAVDASARSAPAGDVLLSRIRYSDLFRSGTDMDADKLAAAAEFLKSHDVRAEIDLFRESAAVEAALPLARAVVLSRYFEGAGVPPDAYAVYAWEKLAEAQAEMRIFRVRGRHG